MVTILGDSNIYSGEENVYSTSDSSLRDWSISTTTNAIITSTVVTNVSSITIKGLGSGGNFGFFVSFTGASSNNKFLTRIQIPLTLDLGAFSSPLVSGEIANIQADPVPQGLTYTSGDWSFNPWPGGIERADFDDGLGNFTEQTVTGYPSGTNIQFKAKTFLSTNIVIIFNANNGGSSIIYIPFTQIPLTVDLGIYSSPLVSGKIANVQADPVPLGLTHTSGDWSFDAWPAGTERADYDDGLGNFTEQTVTGYPSGTDIQFKAKTFLSSNIVLIFNADNGGAGRVFVPFTEIPLTGNLTPDTYVTETYSASGYSGGNWTTTVHGDLIGPDGDTVDFKFSSLIPTFLIYDSTDGGTGRIFINPVFNIGVPVGLFVGGNGTFEVPDFPENVNPSPPNNSGTWEWTVDTPPSGLINLDTTDRLTSDFTIVSAGASSINYTYTGYDGSTILYSDSSPFSYTGLPPVAVNDPGPYSFDVGSIIPTSNDNLNGGTLSALTITDYDGINPSLITINNTTGELIFLSGIAAGDYTLSYTITTDYGTSNVASIDVTITTPPLAVNDLVVSILPGGSITPTDNDNLNGGTLLSFDITDYGTIPVGQQTLVTVNVVDPDAEVTFGVGIDLGTYTLMYTITTNFGTSSPPSSMVVTIANPPPPPPPPPPPILPSISLDPSAPTITSDFINLINNPTFAGAVAGGSIGLTGAFLLFLAMT